MSPIRDDRHEASGISMKTGEPQMDKLPKLIDMIKALVEKRFTGYIKINFTRGAIGRVEKFEEILKK
ncbi:MAG: hypothetical protein A2052_04100 [Deltaproteobacteria bacterium GWA2_54_12]|nr:MAG: hypothetical protein A2052_04100 [Deltaproteobacteria bacterium GWA2_54_12]